MAIDEKLPIYVKCVGGVWYSRYPSSHHAKWQGWRKIPDHMSILKYKELRESLGIYRVLPDPGVLSKV